MSISHRTNRLKVIGNPSVEQLQNGRYRMTFNMIPLNPRNDWFNANKARIFADFGTLESAEMSVDGIPPRTGEAYDNMRLIAVESGNRSRVEGGDYIVQFVYETLSGTFVQVKDDTVDFELNGLRRVQREKIALAGTDVPSSEDTVGTDFIDHQIDSETAVRCFLASFEVDDTDSSRTLTQTFIEAGTVSRTEDFVGSQDSLVLETIGADPSIPTGFSIASKQESNFQGYQTNRFTFLKNDVKLSESEDKVGSELAISQQWFNPATDKTLSGYSLASKNTSDFEGIKTVEFRFLKDNVLLSESEDKVGSQLSISKEVFNGTRSAPSGFVLANERESNVDGIPTRRFTFLKEDVLLSESEDEVGSQNAISQQWFKPSASRDTKANYSLARKEKSDVDGIPTERYTFLKDNVLLSESEDKVASQLAIVKEVFNGTRSAPSGYSLANERESNVDGIPTRRFTFLKNNVLLSESEDKVGSQLAIVKEVFNGTRSAPSGYTLANEQESNVDGIPTRRFTFLKNSVLSLQQDFDDGIKRVSAQAFNLTSSQVIAALSEITSDHLLISESESDFQGIPTRTFVYELNLSDVIDYELNGLKRVTRTELSTNNFSEQNIGTEHPTLSGLFIASQDIDNGGDVKRRVTVVIQAGTLVKDIRPIGDGVLQTTQQDLVTAPTIDADNYIISQDTDNFSGLKRFTTSFISKSDGTTLTSSGGGEKLAFEYEKLVPFTFPGVVNVERIGSSVFTKLEAPVEAIVKADIYTYYQRSADIVDGDFTKESSLGLWNPSSWAKKEAFISPFIENSRIQPAYHNNQGLRGYRTRSSLTLTGDTGVLSREGQLQIDTGINKMVSTVIETIHLEQEESLVNGKVAFQSEPISYVIDSGKYQVQTWSTGGPNTGTWQGTSTKSYHIRGKITVRVEYDGTRWIIKFKDDVFRTDPATFTSNISDTTYRIISSTRRNAASGTDSYQSAYVRPGDLNVAFTTVKQAADGSETLPSDATWDTDLIVEVPSTSEEEIITTARSTTVNSQAIASRVGSIEGRRVGFNAFGSLKVSGGPPDPVGQKYTLDVNVKKAFTDKDGVNIFQKQIVIATCTAVGNM